MAARTNGPHKAQGHCRSNPVGHATVCAKANLEGILPPLKLGLWQNGPVRTASGAYRQIGFQTKDKALRNLPKDRRVEDAPDVSLRLLALEPYALHRKQ